MFPANWKRYDPQEIGRNDMDVMERVGTSRRRKVVATGRSARSSAGRTAASTSSTSAGSARALVECRTR